MALFSDRDPYRIGNRAHFGRLRIAKAISGLDRAFLCAPCRADAQHCSQDQLPVQNRGCDRTKRNAGQVTFRRNRSFYLKRR